MVEFMIQSGADVRQADEHGQLPLQIACAEGHLAIVTLLAKAQATLGWDLQTDELLHAAVSSSQLEVARFLVQAGVDPSGVDASGETPLQVARRQEDSDMIDLLENSAAQMSVSRRCADSPNPCLNHIFQEGQLWMTPVQT